MRTLLRIVMPMARGNKAYEDGSLPKILKSFQERYEPEAAYFYSEGGRRAALFVFDLPDPSHVVAVAEPFFLGLEAEVTMTPVMRAEDLEAGMKKVMKP